MFRKNEYFGKVQQTKLWKTHQEQRKVHGKVTPTLVYIMCGAHQVMTLFPDCDPSSAWYYTVSWLEEFLQLV